mmetsp:Transcript_40596/g.36016  ORF Transcript_40596/g.36016 Transcript_40596/m.36016 type:complete len:125 (+) Transcript_40596:1910-2284(+)
MLLRAHGDEREVRIRGLLYISDGSIEYTLNSPDKSYEVLINYENKDIKWEKINDRIIEMTKKLIEIGRTSVENRMIVKIVYDQTIIRDFLDLKSNEQQEDEVRPDLKLNKVEISNKLIAKLSFL